MGLVLLILAWMIDMLRKSKEKPFSVWHPSLVERIIVFDWPSPALFNINDAKVLIETNFVQIAESSSTPRNTPLRMAQNLTVRRREEWISAEQSPKKSKVGNIFNFCSSQKYFIWFSKILFYVMISIKTWNSLLGMVLGYFFATLLPL